MLWNVIKKENTYLVVKENGEAVSGYPDQPSAVKHQAALYAAQEKGLDPETVTKETLDKMWTEYGYRYVPWAARTFAELDAARDAEGTSQQIKELTTDFSGLVNNIINDPEADVAGAVKTLANEYSTRITKIKKGQETEKKEGWLDSMVTKLKEVFPGLAKFATEPELPKAEPVTGVMVWKEMTPDGETYKWIARYSNNLRDDDFPPEIISADSHKRFVQMVENKEAPLPELWLWHRPEWKCGQADWVTWDEGEDGVGFAMAGGHFDKEAHWLAEHLATLETIGVSHGMPKDSIERSDEDRTVITAHFTKEISPLPTWAAANKWADFIALNKETDMIPQHKKDELVEQWKLDPTQLAALEKLNTQAAAKAKTEAVEHKEATPTPAETPPTPEVPALDLIGEIANAMKEVMAPVLARLETVESQLKELTEDDEAKIADHAKGIPQASLQSLIVQRIIGNDAAWVDGRTSFAKSKPTLPVSQQKEAAGEGNLLSGVVQSIIADHTHTPN